jgi:hypothetical protein
VVLVTCTMEGSEVSWSQGSTIHASPPSIHKHFIEAGKISFCEDISLYIQSQG